MAKIIGNTTATPNPKPDWNQTDETKADYIKNKPEIIQDFELENTFNPNQIYSANAVNSMGDLITYHMTNVYTSIDDKLDKNSILQEFDNEVNHDDYEVYSADAIDDMVHLLGYFLESIENKTNVINEDSTEKQYPSAKAVYDYLSPFTHIQNITEDTYIYNLESGVYYINSEGEYNLYISDGQEYPFHNGIVFVSKSEGSVSWTMFGYDDSWYGIARTGHTNYNHTTDEWVMDYAYSGDFENQTNKVNSIDKTSTNAQYPTAKAVYDYIDNTIENVKKYTYSVENLGNKYVSGTALKYLDLTTTVGEDTSTSPSQWYLACDIKVALAKYENGKITNLVNHPFNISYEDDGRLKINDIDNASEAATMIGTPKFINTYSSIAEEMVDGSIFTKSSRHSMSTWGGEAYGTQAIGIQLRLNIFSPNKAAIEGLKVEFDNIIAKTTHALIYYHNNPFVIGG